MLFFILSLIFKEKCEWIILNANPPGENSEEDVILEYSEHKINSENMNLFFKTNFVEMYNNKLNINIFELNIIIFDKTYNKINKLIIVLENIVISFIFIYCNKIDKYNLFDILFFTKSI